MDTAGTVIADQGPEVALKGGNAFGKHGAEESDAWSAKSYGKVKRARV